MKENERKFSYEEIKTIEDLCKRIDLEDLNMDEKIALAHAFGKDFNKSTVCTVFENYPNIHPSGGASLGFKQDINILILMFILKRTLETSTKQSALIEQNKRIVEQNDTIINQNQEVINLLKEIKDKQLI